MKNCQQVNAQVERVTPVTDSIIELILKPEHYVDYQAGQYLQILCNKEAYSYSIANAPLGSHQYELHIRHDQHNSSIQVLLAQIKQQGKVEIRLPCGDCHIQQLHPAKPILFIAGGTGFAPVKAMIEELLATSDQRCFALYWGARSQNDLYMDEKVKYWRTHVDHFHYASLLPGQGSETNLSSLVLSHHQDHLPRCQAVIGGPFEMVYSIRDTLVAAGMPRSQIFSDAFSFEQQEK